MLKDKIVKIIFFIVSILIFILLVKSFYFDTRIGFKTEILKLIYSEFPVFIDVLIVVIIFPILTFIIVYELISKVVKNNKEELL